MEDTLAKQQESRGGSHETTGAGTPTENVLKEPVKNSSASLIANEVGEHLKKLQVLQNQETEVDEEIRKLKLELESKDRQNKKFNE